MEAHFLALAPTKLDDVPLYPAHVSQALLQEKTAEVAQQRQVLEQQLLFLNNKVDQLAGCEAHIDDLLVALTDFDVLQTNREEDFERATNELVATEADWKELHKKDDALVPDKVENSKSYKLKDFSALMEKVKALTLQVGTQEEELFQRLLNGAELTRQHIDHIVDMLQNLKALQTQKEEGEEAAAEENAPAAAYDPVGELQRAKQLLEKVLETQENEKEASLAALKAVGKMADERNQLLETHARAYTASESERQR